MKNYIFMVIDNGKIPYKSSYTLHIFKGMWSSLAPNGLATQLIDWVK